jgi:hypothetical protein
VMLHHNEERLFWASPLEPNSKALSRRRVADVGMDMHLVDLVDRTPKPCKQENQTELTSGCMFSNSKMRRRLPSVFLLTLDYGQLQTLGFE